MSSPVATPKSTSNTLFTRTKLEDKIPLKMPLSVYFDLTNKCNFTCPFCPTGTGLTPPEGNGIMKLELFQKIVEDFKAFTKEANQKVKKINLFWMGEPLLNKNIYEMARIAKDADIADMVAITTNGSLLNEKNCERLVASGIDIVLVSLYGAKNADYAKVSKNIVFDDIIQGCTNLMRAKTSVGSATPQIFAKLFAPDAALEHLLKNELKCVDVVGTETAFNWNQSFSDHSGQHIQVENPGPMEVCPSSWFVMSIGYNGHVGVCCSDYEYDIRVGDLKANSVKEVWLGKPLQDFRKKMANRQYADIKACNGCSYYKVSHDAETNIDALVATDYERATAIPVLEPVAV